MSHQVELVEDLCTQIQLVYKCVDCGLPFVFNKDWVLKKYNLKEFTSLETKELLEYVASTSGIVCKRPEVG